MNQPDIITEHQPAEREPERAVELVAGPACGEVVSVPEGCNLFTYQFRGRHHVYAMEHTLETAVYQYEGYAA